MLLWIFQSTLPARGATEYVTRDELNTLTFQSTLPARGATDGTALPCRQARISIHAPRTGSDSDDKKVLQKHLDFNPRSPHGERPAREMQEEHDAQISIHAPRTGSDGARIRRSDRREGFQSTLPARGATEAAKSFLFSSSFQSTLPARGATQCQFRHTRNNQISIHAPRTGSDPARAQTSPAAAFQSTLPARGATVRFAICLNILSFQSTLPARGATASRVVAVIFAPFQSTLPARGATGIHG